MSDIDNENPAADFFREHPEHIVGYTTAVMGGREERVMDAVTGRAFGIWLMEKQNVPEHVRKAKLEAFDRMILEIEAS